MRRAVSGDEDGNTMTLLCGENAKAAVERRFKLLQSVHEKEHNWQALSWDEMKRTSAQRLRYLRSDSVPYFSAVPTNWHSQK
jgi:hypothetical protein